MSQVTLEMNWEQFLSAIRRLPPERKLELWRVLASEIDREGIRHRFAEAVAAIRAASAEIPEDEVIADVAQAVDEVRATRQAPHRS
ncbi:MAG: hypothetical protein ACE5F6_21645 [Anaerolineae bacterium]